MLPPLLCKPRGRNWSGDIAFLPTSATTITYHPHHLNHPHPNLTFAPAPALNSNLSLPSLSPHPSFVSPHRPDCFSKIPLALVIAGAIAKGAPPPWDPRVATVGMVRMELRGNPPLRSGTLPDGPLPRGRLRRGLPAAGSEKKNNPMQLRRWLE